MNLALIISTFTTIFFGLVAIILSIKKDKKEKFSIRDSRDAKYNSVEEEFVHMMVHELRSPLTSIKDASELLITSAPSLTEGEKEQFLKIINRQSKSLLDQIASILDAAKFESGTFVLDRKNENIRDLINERIKMFEPQVTRKKITLSSHIEGPIPPVYLDCIRIDQVLNNLISNSIKFTPSGGKVWIEARAVDRNVEISISDTGIGIEKELQDKIFSKFNQIKTPDIQDERIGSGLGLYIAKKIIDAHKGSIVVQSEAGKGTSMKFTLPILDQAEIQESAPLPAQYTFPN